MDNNLKNINQKSEEIQDIIDRMPKKTANIVVLIVTVLATVLCIFGWITTVRTNNIEKKPNES